MLSTLQIQFKLLYGLFGQSNMHMKLPQTSQEGNKGTTTYWEAKSLLFYYIYCIICPLHMVVVAM